MYPGLGYEKVQCSISYTKDKAPKVNYKVVKKADGATANSKFNTQILPLPSEA